MKISILRTVIIFTILLFVDLTFAQNNLSISENKTSKQQTSSEVGQLKLESSSSYYGETYIVTDDNYTNYKKVKKNGIVSIPVGQRKITIIFKEYDDYTFSVNSEKGKLHTQKIRLSKNTGNNKYGYSSYFWIKTKVNTIIKTDYDTEIFIDGKLFGKETIKIDLPLGKHKILAKNLQAGTVEKTLVLTSKRLTVTNIFTRPKKTSAIWMSFFPGASQFYKKQYIKSGAFFGLIASSIALAVKYQFSFKENKVLYEDYKVTYPTIHYPTSVLSTGNKVEKYLEESHKDAKLRDIFLYSAVSLYIINIVDGLFWTPSGGYRKTKETNLLESIKVSISKNEINVGLFYSF